MQARRGCCFPPVSHLPAGAAHAPSVRGPHLRLLLPQRSQLRHLCAPLLQLLLFGLLAGDVPALAIRALALRTGQRLAPRRLAPLLLRPPCSLAVGLRRGGGRGD